MTEGASEEEMRKRLTAKLLTAPPAILLDNIRGRLSSPSLAAALTATSWEDRRLGVSETVTVPAHCAWVATGNNPAVSTEIARRCVRIRLDARVDRPWTREGFRHLDLRAWMTAHRPQLVWAALTIAQAWLAAGRPSGTRVLGGFESWSRVVGGILEHAELKGFLANLSEFYDQADVEGAAWRTFVAAWWERYGTEPVGVAELWQVVNPARAEDGDPVDLNLGDGNERSQRTRLGKALTGYRDRQFGDVRLVAAGTHRRAQLFRLMKVNV
jgi:hypothetical protein